MPKKRIMSPRRTVRPTLESVRASEFTLQNTWFATEMPENNPKINKYGVEGMKNRIYD
jgi:hypothetical protein